MIEKIELFKDRLVKAMEIRNIKAADLSRKTGISESTISQYRSGYAMPKEKKLAIIADALNVNPTWLMGLNVGMEIVEDPMQSERLISYIDGLTKSHELRTYFDKIAELPEDYRKIVFNSIDRIYEAYKLTENIK